MGSSLHSAIKYPGRGDRNFAPDAICILLFASHTSPENRLLLQSLLPLPVLGLLLNPFVGTDEIFPMVSYNLHCALS